MKKVNFLWVGLGVITYFLIKYFSMLIGIDPKYIVPFVVVGVFIASYFMERKKKVK